MVLDEYDRIVLQNCVDALVRELERITAHCADRGNIHTLARGIAIEICERVGCDDMGGCIVCQH